MAARSKIPSPREHARQWAKLQTADRRRIYKAVSRGEALTNRKEARLAVGTARQQLRYWRRVRWVGPLMGLVVIPDWSSVVVASAAGALLMGLISTRRRSRAAAAEQANLERLGAR